MTDEESNVVLRLLREIRGKLEDHDKAFDGLHERMTAIERHMEDVKESVGYALGLSAHAGVAHETTGRRPDRTTEEIARLPRRVETLENGR